VTQPSQSPAQLEQLAMSHFRQGNLPSALDAFRLAQESYSEEGREDKSAEMLNSICVTLLQARRPQEALEAVRDTPALFARIGDRAREGQALGNLAAALEACGDLEQAEASYVSALERLREAGDRDSEAVTLAALSKLQLRRGQPLVSLASMQASLESGQRKNPLRKLLRRILGFPFKLLGRSGL
jgi:tetratricopeptide (TPR) repeat protein